MTKECNNKNYDMKYYNNSINDLGTFLVKSFF